MSVRSDGPSGEGTRASWGAPVEAYAVFDGFGNNVRLYLRDIRAGRPGLARGVHDGVFVYSEVTEEEKGRETAPALTLSETEARAIYEALRREFGEPEVRYADAEFLRSVYEREASRLDRLMFSPPVIEGLGPERYPH